ncbi:MAG: helix-hairpin-helix domain-containing protein [Ignavibacterium sp.]|nr:MAG: helix-hairpin-helix domain-containing protein [Ignavibacterium sp.]
MTSSIKYSILIIFLPVFVINSQTDSTYLRVEEVLENILQEPAGEVDDSNLYEIIEQLITNPLELNTSTVNDLMLIPAVNLEVAEMIVNHRKKYGDFFSVEELHSVPGLEKDIADQIKPFVYIRKEPLSPEQDIPKVNTMENLLSNTNFILRSRVTNDLQTRNGFVTNRFEGTKPKFYNRMFLQYDSKVQLGVLAEKDAGEVSINEFTSYHLAIRDFGMLYRFVLGDYIIEFGQGLALWSPYGFLKGADAIFPLKKKDRVLRPYSSATETLFLRGAAASIKISDFVITGFYSKKKFDANIDTFTGDILSTSEAGLHRTESEISKRNTAEERIIGARVDYQIAGLLRTGLLHYQSNFSNNFQPSNVFDLTGNEFNYTSFHYDLIIQNFNLFGEFVYNGTSVASINSVQFYVGRNFTFTTSVRNYPRNYISFRGYAFGERAGIPTNEFGFYTGIKWRIPIGILNLYYDQFRFPFTTFLNPQPSEGDELLVDFISKPINRLETRLRYKYENKDVNGVIDNTKQLVKRLRQLVRFELIYSPTRKLRLKGRFEYNDYRVASLSEQENGYLFFQDVRFSPTQNLNLYTRIIFFRTDSFNSAIYEYENDLTGVLTNLALYGEGIRWYLILRYRPLNFLTISAKYSETYKPKEDIISSGVNEIEGNVDNRLSLQIDVIL